jgi:predicted RNase H-like nuclease
MTGVGVSLQAYGMRNRIFEVEPFARSNRHMVEVHPELSFAALNGGQPVNESKVSWSGIPFRRALLEAAGIFLPDDLNEANRVPPNDVLDAGAASWTALRILQGKSETLPNPPELDAEGIVTAIHV